VSKQYLNDFQRGYNYARLWHTALLAKKSPQDILELAKAFLLFTGNNAELAKGIGTYYREQGMERMEAGI